MTNNPGEDDPRPQDPAGFQPGVQPGMQPSYPAPFPPGAPLQYAPDHPRATTSLVLGILGVVLCQILAPFAWVIGKKTLNEIDASQGRVGGRGSAQAGYVLGIVGTVLLAVGLLVMVIYVVFMVAVIGGGIATSSTVEF